MPFLKNSAFQFISLSAVIHILVAVLFVAFSHQEPQRAPIEITFGTGPAPSAGNNSVIQELPKALKVKPHAKPVLEKRMVVTDAPKVQSDVNSKNTEAAQETRTADQVSGVSNGTGLGGNGDGGSPDGVNSPKAKYKKLLTDLINSKKQYPQKAYSLLQEGTVVVRIFLSKNGKLKSVEVLDKSPYKTLDVATVDLIKKIHKFPPIPKELGMNEMIIQIPIEYKIEM